MDLQELRELMRLLEESSLAELEVEEDGRRVRLCKAAAASATYINTPAAAPAPVAASAPAPAAPAAAPAEPEDEFAGLVLVECPMVGTFYAANAPGEPPFVLPGDRVAKDQTVCIVEAMKIMNEVVARQAGVIERVLVENGEPVEFGQPLFAMRPL
jgi:acetyl-CoA carboxylase biotin carboxyl carrier protein